MTNRTATILLACCTATTAAWYDQCWDVPVDQFEEFTACHQGPNVTVCEECLRWDFDGDGNVDLQDAMIYLQGVAFGLQNGGR